MLTNQNKAYIKFKRKIIYPINWYIFHFLKDILHRIHTIPLEAIHLVHHHNHWVLPSSNFWEDVQSLFFSNHHIVIAWGFFGMDAILKLEAYHNPQHIVRPLFLIIPFLCLPFCLILIDALHILVDFSCWFCAHFIPKLTRVDWRLLCKFWSFLTHIDVFFFFLLFWILLFLILSKP